MTIIPKAIYRFNVSSMKLPDIFHKINNPKINMKPLKDPKQFIEKGTKQES